jgi:hypothetical protein
MIDYTNTNFQGHCSIHEDFKPYLDKMNEIAKRYAITVIVTSSYRVDANVKGAIVTPATHSNHMIGHAIDCNLKQGKELYNSTRLYMPTGEIKQFIDECVKAGMRWGGDFGKPDPVHFDSGLNITNFPKWEQIYKQLHS